MIYIGVLYIQHTPHIHQKKYLYTMEHIPKLYPNLGAPLSAPLSHSAHDKITLNWNSQLI